MISILVNVLSYVVALMLCCLSSLSSLDEVGNFYCVEKLKRSRSKATGIFLLTISELYSNNNSCLT